MMFETENNCPQPIMEDKVDELKGEVLKVQGKVDSIEATVNEPKKMLKQLIPKAGIVYYKSFIIPYMLQITAF